MSAIVNSSKGNNNKSGGGGGGGFFNGANPWKDIVSVVSDAIDKFDASHDPTTPLPPTNTNGDKQQQQQQQQQQRKKSQRGVKHTTEPTPTTKDVIMTDPQQPQPTRNNKPSKMPPATALVTPQKKQQQQQLQLSSRKMNPELVSEQKATKKVVDEGEEFPIVEFAKEAIIEPKTLFLGDDNSFSNNHEQDWELLSDRCSFTAGGEGSSNCQGVFVARAGSVRSIDQSNNDNSSSHNTSTLSVPFKIQRTLSSSTIDSQDNALGPSGKGVLGVDYVEHVVLPTDTLQGICIAYKVSASSLRRANHFTGHKIHSAPKKLLIPLSKQALRTGFIRVQDTDSKEYKLHYFQAEFPNINMVESKAYLELADWDLNEALQSAKADREWEKEEAGDTDGEDLLKGGQIGVKIDFKGSKPLMKLRGIGRAITGKIKEVAPSKLVVVEDESSSSSADDGTYDDEASETNKKSTKAKQKVVIHSRLPPIATKSVQTEDLFNAAPEHCNFGLELKPISKKKQSHIETHGY